MIRTFTRHGLRAHYSNPALWEDGVGVTLCGKEAVALASRSRFFRRRLAQASMCARCERIEEEGP